MSIRERYAVARPARLLLVSAFLSPVLWAGQETHKHPAPEKLGSVSFATSCQADVQREFERGVALLHSFAYPAAEASFKSVAEKDPKCAIAHWGVAMTYFHQLWDPPIVPGTLRKGREEVGRAEHIGGGSDRERRFIAALALLYERDSAEISYRDRASKYAGAMGELAAAYPNDAEAQIFYALALLADASPFDKSHAKQKRAVEILEPLFARYPRHPGVPHYLIHACDNQEMARKGLPAARAYSKVAPSAPHALHMPSHIFTRLGMWDDSVTSNRPARTAARDQGDIGEELHAMDYLVYAYLQEGREEEAHEILEQVKAMPKLDQRDFKIAYAATAIPVRYAVERRQWTEAAAILPASGAPPHVQAIAIWARAIGLARSGHAADARLEIAKLRQLQQRVRTSRAEYSRYWAEQVAIQESEARAWSAQAAGRADEAVKLLREAAEREDGVEKLPVTPGPIIPAREQLGDLLLEQNRPRMARMEFLLALSNAPERRGSLAGITQASKALGNTGSRN